MKTLKNVLVREFFKSERHHPSLWLGRQQA